MFFFFRYRGPIEFRKKNALQLCVSWENITKWISKLGSLSRAKTNTQRERVCAVLLYNQNDLGLSKTNSKVNLSAWLSSLYKFGASSSCRFGTCELFSNRNEDVIGCICQSWNTNKTHARNTNKIIAYFSWILNYLFFIRTRMNAGCDELKLQMQP